MNIIFIHQNFPAQFRHIAQALVAENKHRVIAICDENAPGLEGVECVHYKPQRGNTPNLHQYLMSSETHIIRGQSVAGVLLALQQKGVKPDAIVAHVGWGEAIFCKDIYPTVPLITFFEFYYHAKGADVGFDPEMLTTLDDSLRIRVKNVTNLLSLEASDIGISPTAWQRSLYPQLYQDKIRLIHEGINTELAKPDEDAWISLSNGVILTKNVEVITYVARNLEPYRGFHQFMRALEIICQQRPNAQVIVIGGDDVSYGRKLPHHETYREHLLKQVNIDTKRVHFLGKVPYQQYLNVLQISAVHVYLTVPFVLSWSMLEAMSTGCVVVASNTAPVKEVIEHGKNGLLVDYFSPDAIANQVIEVLSKPEHYAEMRVNARETILQNYPLHKGVEAYKKLFDEISAKR